MDIADNLSRQGIPTYVFQFSYDAPGLDGRLRASHTGELPFLFGNQTDQDHELLPPLHGVDRNEVCRVVATDA